MSQHPSLRSVAKDKQHRSVLKRYERVHLLRDKEKWDETKSVFGLPKVKVTKFKIKKEKAVAADATAVAAPGAAPAAGAPAAKAAGAKDGAKSAGDSKK